MRYADAPTVEREVAIQAPVASVWSLVTDINVAAQFSSEFLGATWLDDGPAPSARFVGRNRHDALGEWETTSYVSRFDPQRAFAWDVTDPEQPSASWWFELEQGDDGVRLRHGARIGPGPSGLTIAISAMPEKEERIVERRLAELGRNIEATLLGIQSLAEAAR